MEKYNSDPRAAFNERRRIRRKKIVRRRLIYLLCFTLIMATVITAVSGILKILRNSDGLEELKSIPMPTWVDVELIDYHSSARSGKALDEVNNIVLHYVGNPGSTAQNNRDYFNKRSTSVSSHFVVGLEGEIIQCLPLWEKSAASNERNRDTISIEVCHPDESGKFNEATYNSVIKLISYILYNLGLDESAVIRHYDITEKLCPLYYVENEDEWDKLKKDVGTALNEYKKK